MDGSGNAYVTGYTDSPNTTTGFPTQYPYQANNAGDLDVFVTKLSPDGLSLIYSTYLGGDGSDWGVGIAVDGSGKAYVTGSTGSPNTTTGFPTQYPYYQANNAGDTDVFLTKLSFDETLNTLTLDYSTYLGGSGSDSVSDIAVDGVGNAYVTGYTHSHYDFPLQNPIQSHDGGTDAFVTKLNAAGDALVYSTRLVGDDPDFLTGIAVDGFGNAYMTGYTYSLNFPMQSPIQATKTWPGYDALVIKINAAGNALVYSTYLGGDGYYDRGYGIAVDGSGNAYVTGMTNSPGITIDFPTENYIQLNNAGGYDVFVAQIIERWYVKELGSGAKDGTSWDDAFDSIQDAIDAASPGGEIWVAAGTYVPGTLRTDTFQLKTGVALYGGFNGTETLRDERDWEANVTILSGDINGDDVGFTNNGENVYHVVSAVGADGATIDGFTIAGGNASYRIRLRLPTAPSLTIALLLMAAQFPT
jgi:hypothetical protein